MSAPVTAHQLTAYRDRVSAAMEERYGITWADACGDWSPLERALGGGGTPEDFVRRWGDRHDLTPKTEW